MEAFICVGVIYELQWIENLFVICFIPQHVIECVFLYSFSDSYKFIALKKVFMASFYPVRLPQYFFNDFRCSTMLE